MSSLSSGTPHEVLCALASAGVCAVSLTHAGTGSPRTHLALSSPAQPHTPLTALDAILAFIAASGPLAALDADARVADAHWRSRGAAARAAGPAVELLVAELDARLRECACLAGAAVLSVADAACAAALHAAGAAAVPLPAAVQRWYDAVSATAWWAAAVASAAAAGAAMGAGGGKKVGEGGAAKAAPREKGALAAGAGGSIADAVLALSSYVTTAPVSASDDASMSLPLAQTLATIFSAALHAAFPHAAGLGQPARVDVDANANPRFVHHYQCNAPLALYARLKGPGDRAKTKAAAAAGAAGGEVDAAAATVAAAPPATPDAGAASALPPAPASPKAVAEAIMAAVTAAGPHAIIARMEVSGPGYVNIYLPANYVVARLSHVLVRGLRGCLPPGERVRTVVIDYSSPNIAKDMHIGHLRSTIIGDALARLLEFGGHTVHRVNHVGDWGTQFGMLIAHLKEQLATGAVTDAGLDGSIADLTAFYKAAKVRFDNEPEFKTRAHAEVVALQAGDATNLALWRRMVAVSAAMFAVVYKMLGVDPRLELCGESFYNDKIGPVIAELDAAGLLEASDGATVLTVPGQEVPLMVRKSDGGFGYDSTDLAAIKYRLKTLRADWLIYVVDAGQSLHFDLVFAGARRAGWYDPATTRVEHTGFGVVQGEDRKKFKTRDGSTVRLQAVLDEAKARAAGVIAERVAASASSPLAAATPSELDAAACVLGYDGVKYFDLRQNRTQDYVFSYERMLSPDGDTVVYLEYAHARLHSILRKARAGGGEGGPPPVDVDALLVLPLDDAGALAAAFDLTHPSEVVLAGEVMRFGEVFAGVQVDCMPHRLCEYMYGLAGKATDFHRDCNVLGEGTPARVRDTRLRLVAAAAKTLGQCMRLLGITPLERI